MIISTKEMIGDFDFLSVDYPCDIYYNEIMYPSLKHAMIAAKTDDAELHSLIASISIDELDKVQISDPVSDEVLSERLITLVIEKYKNNSLMEKLMIFAQDIDEYSYDELDVNGIIAKTTKAVSIYGTNYNSVFEYVHD